MIRKIVAIVTAIGALNGFTCTEDGVEGIVPENNLYISPSEKSTNGMTEALFNEVIDKVEAIYEPIIDKMGAKLSIARKWNDGTVNAYAQRSGRTWRVSMFGGLARHEAITPDGFALVVCHEVGHHIGGAPKKAGWFGSWATNEGQADYFATLKCLRKMFRAEIKETRSMVKFLKVPKLVVKTCEEQFSSEDDQAICQRGAMAGLSTAKLFQDLRDSDVVPKFGTPSTDETTRTDDNHPATQCRLDTYYQGALCQIDELIDVDQKDETVGVCYRDSGDTVGVRPLCWFAPKK